VARARQAPRAQQMATLRSALISCFPFLERFLKMIESNQCLGSPRRGLRAFFGFGAAITCLFVGGCALESDTGQDSAGGVDLEHAAASTTQPVIVTCSDPKYTKCGETVDQSGTITVRTYQCGWSPTSQAPFAGCSVEPDFLLVGGGIEVDDLSNQIPGALLVGSWPSNNPNNGSQVGDDWSGFSKDQISPNPHRIRAYAIGLKLAGVSKASLQAQSFIHSAESSTTLSHAPTVTAVDNRPGDIVVGGGGYGVSSNGMGQLLTSTRPEGSNGWTTSSKDHGISDPGRVVSVVIGIPRCPVGYLGSCLAVSAGPFLMAGVGSGLFGLVSQAAAPGVAVSVGGEAQYNGPGRMITSLFPFISSAVNQGWSFLYTKDHIYPDTGSNIVYVVSLRPA